MTPPVKSDRPSLSPAAWGDFLFLGIAASFFCLWNLGGGSLASWDEAQYAQVAKEIVATGNWVYLRFLGTDWYVKPPLAIWMTAAFFKFFGTGEFAARLFSALSGIGVIFLTYAVGWLALDRRAALLGAGALLSSTDFLHFARWGMMDIPNLLCFTAAIAFFLRAGSEPSGRAKSEAWYAAFGVALGAGFMTKGPVILLAPAVLFLYSLWAGEWAYLRSPFLWGGFALALILALPWHLAVFFHNPQAFLKDFIGNHWLRRSAEAIEGHAAGVYFYVRVLINKFHPWVILLPAALPAVLWGAARGSKGMRLIAVWTAVIFLFFTFGVATKLHWYILPMYPALALAIGVFLGRWIPEAKLIWAKGAILAVLVLHFPFSNVMRLDYSAGIKEIAPEVKRTLGPQDRVFLYLFHEQPAAVFYFDRTTLYADSPEELDAALAKKKPVAVIVPAALYGKEEDVFRSRGLREAARSRGPKDPVVFLVR